MIELRTGDLTLGLVPSLGGSVSHFRLGAIDLMRPLSSEAHLQDVRCAAMFPMVPYANRIAGNAFKFGGEVWRFIANNPPERFNVHGTGWQSAWDIEDRKADEAVLVLNHLAPDEPYSYLAKQQFSLSKQRLVVTITLTNRGDRTMPFGFGFHPWFKRAPDVTVAFRATHFWMEGPDGIATDALRTPPELDFTVARALPETWRNNDYGGWSGTAEICSPSQGFGLRIEADPIFRHLVLYANPVSPCFCLEPQTNAVCAFNKMNLGHEADLGVIELRPGSSAAGSVSFIPFALQGGHLT
jgi:aldose 1-epimerase